jgi:hypothetical protein
MVSHVYTLQPLILVIVWIWKTEVKGIYIVKPTRCTIFKFIEHHSTCFGWSFCPLSGVLDCTHSIRYMSYRLADCLLASIQLTCRTYTWCCLHSLELPMMDEKTVRNMQSVIYNKLKKCASSWFYYKNISWCTVPWSSKQKRVTLWQW